MDRGHPNNQGPARDELGCAEPSLDLASRNSAFVALQLVAERPHAEGILHNILGISVNIFVPNRSRHGGIRVQMVFLIHQCLEGRCHQVLRRSGQCAEGLSGLIPPADWIMVLVLTF